MTARNPLEATIAEVRLGEATSLRPAGVYDHDLQLSEEQVVELKQRLRRDPEMIGSVAVHIVDRLTADEVPGAEDPFFSSEEELDEYKFGLVISWTRSLEVALSLPASEWPDGLTPPATFAVALQELDMQAEQEKSDG